MTNIIITENQSIATFNNVEASYICNVLEQAAAAGVSIDMIAQFPTTCEKISFAFTFYSDSLQKLLPLPAPLINCGNVKITVKSQDMVTGAGFASKVFGVLRDLSCTPLLITTGIDEIALLVHESSRVDLERELKKVFL